MPFAFRTALRSLLRRPADAALGGLGLVLGLACFALVMLHVSAERAADADHSGGERLVRIETRITDAAGGVQTVPSVPRPVGGVVAGDPAVEASARAIYRSFQVERPSQVETAEALAVGSDFLTLLDGYALAAGDPATALTQPGAVVLTTASALRLTGDPLPVGRTIDVAGHPQPYTVSAVVESPGRSHLVFDALVPFPSAQEWSEDEWGAFDLTTYALLRPGADAGAFRQRVQDAVDASTGEMMSDMGMSIDVAARPVESLYLSEDEVLMNPYLRTGEPGLLRVLGLVGLFVLAIAAVNFVNLATARSAERAREVGVRKAVGSGRGALVVQFLAEAVLLALVAGGVALAVVALALPVYNGLTNAGLALSDLLAPAPLLAGLGLAVLVGLLAGAYPAFVLSSFRPADTLRGRYESGRGGGRLRRGLVVFQFGISTALLVATLVVGAQLRHLRTQDPGFDRDRVVLVETAGLGEDDKRALKDAFARVTGVEAVSLTWAPPTEDGWESQQVTALGASGATQSMETVIVDGDYVETFGIEVVAGRDLNAQRPADAETGLLLNATAARALGWTPTEAVGKTIETSMRSPGTVVGVVADYAHHGVGESARPQVFFEIPGGAGWAAVRLPAGTDAAALDRLERVWESRVPQFPFDSTFLDAAVDAQYRAEERLARAFALFAGMAVTIACLGLFGLAAHAMQRRRKEVGVRKVLGATVAQIVRQLTSDVARPVLVGVILAVPVAWWAMARWLDGFAERVALTPVPFLVAGLGALVVAVATVVAHTLRAATTDPVHALHSD